MSKLMRFQTTFSRQKGVATLVTAVVLMLAVFGATYFMSESVINESQNVANSIRSKEAFHSSQSGIDHALAVIQGNPSTVSGAITNPVSFTLGSYDVRYSTQDDVITVESVGTSKDQTVLRTITYSIARLPAESAPPNVPIISKAGVNLSGDVLVVNNEEDMTVWSGDEFDSGGSLETRINIDGVDDQVSTTSTTRGPDVVDNDQALASVSEADFLSAFFNGATTLAEIGQGGLDMVAEGYPQLSKTNSKDTIYYGLGGTGTVNINSSGVATSSLETSDYQDYTGDVFNIADFPKNNTTGYSFIGTPDNPVKIVVDGNIKFNSTVVIFGVIIARGIEVGSGDSHIYGGIVAIDDVSMSGGPTIEMDELILSNINNSDAFGPVTSSWRDWN